jgi:hypothetical protein
LRIPIALVEKLTTGSPFARAIAAVTSKEELANLQASLVALSNRVLSADRIKPGDDEAVSAVLDRMAATLDLGIEFLSHGRDENALLAVQTVPLLRLFQLGVSLIGKVRRLAVTLTRKTPFSHLAPEVSLFEPADAGLLAACARLRPMFPRGLESPPAAGERPFGSLDDLRLATAALERIGTGVAWLLAFGVRPEDLVPANLAALGVADSAAIDAGLLARTVLAHELLGQPRAVARPLDREEVGRLDGRLGELSRTPDVATQEKARLLASSSTTWPKPPPTPAALAVLGSWIERLFDEKPPSVLTRQ